MNLRARPRHSIGQALVEFALVIPLFLILLFGVIDIGRIAYINNAMSEGAREASRWGSVQGRSSTAATRATIRDRAISSMAAVPNPTVTVTCEAVDGTARTTCVTNNVLVVSISSTVTLFTPVVSQLVGTRTFTATSKVAVNQ